MSETLLTAIDKGVGTITLNRPERRNAMDPPLMKALADAVTGMADNRNVRVVILTGAGGAFCAGGDIQERAKSEAPVEKTEAKNQPKTSLEDRIGWLRRRMEAARLLHIMPKPTIAVIPGAAAGAGLSLAAACDLRLAAESAVFLTAFLKVGVSGDYGGSYFLTRLLGSAKARELYLLNEKLTAQDALQIGLVNRVFADDMLATEAAAIAERLAKSSAPALQYMKKNLNAAEEGSLDQLFDMEAQNMILSGNATRRAYLAAKEDK